MTPACEIFERAVLAFVTELAIDGRPYERPDLQYSSVTKSRVILRGAHAQTLAVYRRADLQ